MSKSKESLALDYPYREFEKYYELVKKQNYKNPNAFHLCTMDSEGGADGRILLLKDFNFEQGFIFYTNMQSRKGQQLENNPKVAMTFFWDSLGLQIRLKGSAKLLSHETSQSYFSKRPRESQIGAWASQQSAPLENFEDLAARFEEFKEKYSDPTVPVPCPPHWRGNAVTPDEFEFWEEGEHRLHYRRQFQKSADGKSWVMTILNP